MPQGVRGEVTGEPSALQTAPERPPDVAVVHRGPGIGREDPDIRQVAADRIWRRPQLLWRKIRSVHPKRWIPKRFRACGVPSRMGHEEDLLSVEPQGLGSHHRGGMQPTRSPSRGAWNDAVPGLKARSLARPGGRHPW